MQPTGTSMRILLVDDVQLDRMQLAIRLKQLGHIVKAVGSGIEALNTYESFDPELVLLDISMVLEMYCTSKKMNVAEAKAIAE